MKQVALERKRPRRGSDLRYDMIPRFYWMDDSWNYLTENVGFSPLDALLSVTKLAKELEENQVEEWRDADDESCCPCCKVKALKGERERERGREELNRIDDENGGCM